jgi:inhibitor of KinA sporulation pathway (predicted exonuclease)
MFREKEKILCVDVEMTCWESGAPPEGQRAEIIQIGYCLLNTATLEVEDKNALYVKPRFSEVSKFCTELTGITPKQAKSGMLLSSACKNLIRKSGSRRYAWAGWGDERESFLEEANQGEIEYPFNEQFLDISAMATLLLDMPIRMSLDKAIAAFDMKFIGRRHDGADDAYNQARILAKIMKCTRSGFKS